MTGVVPCTGRVGFRAIQSREGGIDGFEGNAPRHLTGIGIGGRNLGSGTSGTFCLNSRILCRYRSNKKGSNSRQEDILSYCPPLMTLAFAYQKRQHSQSTSRRNRSGRSYTLIFATWYSR